MAVEILTKDDLQQFKQEMLVEISKLLKIKPDTQRQWLQSYEVRKLLKISPGTLQHLRVNGKLPYSKIGGKMFYDFNDISKMIENEKRKN